MFLGMGMARMECPLCLHCSLLFFILLCLFLHRPLTTLPFPPFSCPRLFYQQTHTTERERVDKQRIQSLPCVALFHFVLGLDFFLLSHFPLSSLSLSRFSVDHHRRLSLGSVYMERVGFFVCVCVCVCFCRFCFFSKVGQFCLEGPLIKKLSLLPMSNVHVCLLLVSFPLSFPIDLSLSLFAFPPTQHNTTQQAKESNLNQRRPRSSFSPCLFFHSKKQRVPAR